MFTDSDDDTFVTAKKQALEPSCPSEKNSSNSGQKKTKTDATVISAETSTSPVKKVRNIIAYDDPLPGINYHLVSILEELEKMNIQESTPTQEAQFHKVEIDSIVQRLDHVEQGRPTRVPTPNVTDLVDAALVFRYII